MSEGKRGKKRQRGGSEDRNLNDNEPNHFPVSKRRKIERPRLHFMNKLSKSSKYSYKISFETQKANSLIFPDPVIEIIISYLHIYHLYLIRKDEYFEKVTNVKMKSNPNYLHDIFVKSTEISDLCQLVKYDPKWFNNNIMQNLKIEIKFNRIELQSYINNCINRYFIDHDTEIINNLKLSLKLTHNILNLDLLNLIIRKLFIMDKSSHSLVHHLTEIGLRQLASYHKPFLLG